MPRQRENGGRGFRFKRKLPAFERLRLVRGPENEQVWNGAQRGQMFDRLMGRAVLAKTDGIMREDLDRANSHQGGEPKRWPAIIAEGQK